MTLLVPESFISFFMSHDFVTVIVTDIMSLSCFVTCVTITLHLLSKSKIKKSKIKSKIK